MAAIRTMKRFDKQKEPAALIFSKAAGSKWARKITCSNQRLFYFPLVGAAMAVINERREIFFMENSFDKSMVLWLWQLVGNNQPQGILSNSLSFVGCYGNGSANLCDGKNSHKNRVRP